jgi:nitrite reductase (NADH) small subunit
VLVVDFNARGGQNCVETAAGAFVYARTGQGSFVLPASCPHRGGPLHLATIDPASNRLVCPWHERGTTVTRWMSRSVPAVRRGNTVTAVLPTDDPRHQRTHRPLSADLDRTPTSG